MITVVFLEDWEKRSLLNKERNYVALGLLIHQGLATNELQKINMDDLNLTKAVLKRPKDKNSAEHTLPLHASQIGTLIRYLDQIRPQFFDYCEQSERLFLTLSKNDSDNLMVVLQNFKQQVKTLDAHFLNFRQIRTSVITHWLKVYGLRKTQSLAGHRSITSTRKYVVGELESLTEDITKFNPF